MRELWRHIELLPHGSRLLTPSARFWFFSARVLILTMASAEAMAWGYLGFLFGDGWTRVAIGVFSGAVIFAVVWIIDVSLITLDRASNEHTQLILNEKIRGGVAKTARETLAFSLRVILLGASLTVTAPYLAQLVLQNDIERLMDSRAVAELEGARIRLSAPYAARLDAKREEIQKKRSSYEVEVAGKGASGRYGLGPAAGAIDRTLAKLEGELAFLERQRGMVLEAFDGLARDWRTNRARLTAEYNLSLPRQSILENRKALEELRQRPENATAELAVKVFLASIFFGLLLLKLFEPSSVRLYLSEVLQQEYNRYLAGSFDSMLPPTETSAQRDMMSPQRFREFLVDVWRPARVLEQELAGVRAREEIAAKHAASLERLQDQVEGEVEALRIEAHRLRQQNDDANQSLTELDSAIAAVRRDIETFSTELAAEEHPQAGLDDRSRLEYERTRLAYRSRLGAKLRDATRALRELQETAPTEKEKYERAVTAAKRIETQVTKKELQLAELDQKIDEMRILLADTGGDRVRTFLRGARA